MRLLSLVPSPLRLLELWRLLSYPINRQIISLNRKMNGRSLTPLPVLMTTFLHPGPQGSDFVDLKDTIFSKFRRFLLVSWIQHGVRPLGEPYRGHYTATTYLICSPFAWHINLSSNYTSLDTSSTHREVLSLSQCEYNESIITSW